MKILFLATNPAIEASTRFRVLQYFPALVAAGHQPTLSTFFQETPAAGPQSKMVRVAKGALARVRDFATATRYDVIVVHRELLPYNLNHFAGAMGRRVPLVYDFDDAVWLARPTGMRKLAAALGSTRSLVDSATLVLAGNPYLADYARQTNDRVELIPTVVDTELYRPPNRPAREVPVIGWIGSPTTAHYLQLIVPALEKLAETHRFRLRIIGAGRDIRIRGVDIEAPPWRMAAEEELFRELDIGIYPLADDQWSLGKSGFKAIQYMACGVPCVVSPVGVVLDIVDDGVNGLWAQTANDWRSAIAHLLDSPEARLALGMAGRRRIESDYSLSVTAPKFIAALESAVRQ